MEKLTMDKKELSKTLKQLKKCMVKSSLPILGNVLIDTENNTITATNLSEAIIRNIEIEESGEDKFKCLIRHNFLTEAVKVLTDDKVTITIDENVITKFNDSYTNIRLDEVKEFPTIPDTGDLKHVCDTNQNTTKKLTNVLPKKMESDMYGVHRDSVLFGDNRMVATDGNRLHIAYLPVENSALIPVAALRLAESLSKDFEIHSSNEFCWITFDDGVIIARNNSEQDISKYPEYKKVMVEDGCEFVKMDSKELLEVINASSPVLFNNSDRHAIKVSFEKGEVAVSAVSDDGVEFKGNMLAPDLPVLDEGNNYFFANKDYCVDALKCFDGEFELGVHKGGKINNSVIMMKNNSFTAGIMPTRE